MLRLLGLKRQEGATSTLTETQCSLEKFSIYISMYSKNLKKLKDMFQLNH